MIPGCHKKTSCSSYTNLRYDQTTSDALWHSLESFGENKQCQTPKASDNAYDGNVECEAIQLVKIVGRIKIG